MSLPVQMKGKRGAKFMLSGIMLIIVTMFAVLGAYYLSDVLTMCLFKANRLQDAVVVLPSESLEQMWNGVLDVRRRLPEASIIVLSDRLEQHGKAMEPGMENVVFATPETIGALVCSALAVQKGQRPKP